MEMKDIIKTRRTELKLTLKEVADYVGVSEATLSRWESGNITNPRRDRIAALARILDISPSVIVGELEVDEKTPAPESGLDDFDMRLLAIIKTLSAEQKQFLLAQLQTLQANQAGKE